MASRDQVSVDIVINDSGVDRALAANRTKLENFRQQIVVDTQAMAERAAAQSTSFLQRLSGQQRLQLSYQVNDIVTGLASGQSPFQILAQQGGQIAQIFQQTKLEQEAVAAATTKASIAQAAFTASSTASVAPQAAVAASSTTTAASMTQASGAATIMGASVGNLAGLLSAGAIAGFAVYKVTQQIEHVARQRLELEQKVTSEFGKQNLLAAELAKLRNEAATRRADAEFMRTGSPEMIQSRVQELERQRQALVDEAADLRRRQQAVQTIDEQYRRGSIFGKLMPGDFAKKTVDDLAKQATAAEARAGEFTQRILELDQGVLDARQRRADADIEITRFAERAKIEVAMEAYRQAEKAENELNERRKRAAEETKQNIQQMIKAQEEAIRGAYGMLAERNPYLRLFMDANDALLKLRENAVGLSRDILGGVEQIIRSENSLKLFRLQLDNRVQVSDLLDDARQFRNGRLDQEDISKTLERRLKALGAPTSGFESRTYQFDPVSKMVGEMLARPAAEAASQRELDQRIVALTQGVDPARLTRSQNVLAAAAREREARELSREQKNAQEFYTNFNSIIQKQKGLKVIVTEGTHIVKVINKSDRAEVNNSPSQGDTNNFYGSN